MEERAGFFMPAFVGFHYGFFRSCPEIVILIPTAVGRRIPLLRTLRCLVTKRPLVPMESGLGVTEGSLHGASIPSGRRAIVIAGVAKPVFNPWIFAYLRFTTIALFDSMIGLDPVVGRRVRRCMCGAFV